ncbi:MAG: hypothetical protein U9P49_03155, partial [Thermodesulfobacteriota bacterium]|nr:hypothetical protein [Thermodesulfobacteriota bacterium]
MSNLEPIERQEKVLASRLPHDLNIFREKIAYIFILGYACRAGMSVYMKEAAVRGQQSSIMVSQKGYRGTHPLRQ